MTFSLAVFLLLSSCSCALIVIVQTQHTHTVGRVLRSQRPVTVKREHHFSKHLLYVLKNTQAKVAPVE